MYQLLVGGSALPSKSAEAARTLLRIATGVLLFLNHGLMKVPPSEGFIGRVGEMGFPFPVLFAWMCMFAEVVCAWMLVAGVATRFASFFVVGNMFVVVFMAQAGNPLGDREDAILFLVSAIFFLFAGAGRYSIDNVLRQRSGASLRVAA